MTYSTQSEGQGVRQPENSNSPRQNAGHKKKVSPPAAPKAAESKVDQPTLQYNQSYTCDTAKPVQHDGVDILNAASTAVVGAFTVVLAVVGLRQFFASRKAERAWIVTLPPGPPTRNPAGDSEIRWELENNGHTPAWVTALGSAAVIRAVGQELPANPPYTMAGPFTREGTVLAPKGKVLRGLTIPFEQMNAVEQDTHVLYVIGMVEYRDVFGSKHETRYCYRFKTGPSAADPAPRDFYVDGPPAYNRAT